MGVAVALGVEATLGIADATREHKRRLIEGFLATVHPVTDDLKVLKTYLEKESRTLFGHGDDLL